MESSPIKDILYHKINQITESRIQQEISNKNYKKIINRILDECIPKISKIGGDNMEIFGGFAESMMHYLLTNALIPSQRKIIIKNTEVDVIIPDSRTLYAEPRNALILYFAKTSEQDSIIKHLAKLQEIQPINENIWIVAKSKIKTHHKTYEIENKTSIETILDDISDFVLARPQSKFKIFKT